jgi:hypothetical protein
MESITPEYIETIRGNKQIRQRLAYESPLWFGLLYLNRHFTDRFAPFHLEMFHIVADEQYQFVVVMAFRGSGKSTVMNMATVLWSILGKPGKKFVVIVSKTQEQAKNHFANIKEELENNILLREDFGPFAEKPEEWRKLSLDLVYHDAKILSVSRDQSVRGLRHGPHRPDLIICDDLEDSGDAGQGDKIYEQFVREIAPSGEAGTRVIALGNLIDKNSFLMRLRSDALNRPGGIFRAYPFSDSYRRSLWPGKYPDKASIRRFEESVSSGAWTREYLLDAVSDVYYHDSRREPGEKPLWSGKNIGPSLLRMRKAKLIYRRALEKEGKIMYQEALIPPMKEFRIESPFPKNLQDQRVMRFDKSAKIDPSMPAYAQEYQKEMQEALEKFTEAIYDYDYHSGKE